MTHKRKRRMTKMVWEKVMSKLQRQIERKSARFMELLTAYEKEFPKEKPVESEQA